MKRTAASRRTLISKAIRLEWFTLIWMTIEAAVAGASGFMAHSITLIAFGVDSLIELASAGVLMWRLNVELERGQSFSVVAERRASKIAGALLFALAIYVALSAGWSLWRREGGDFSLPGLLVSLIAIPAMTLLSKAKIRVAEALESAALRADAVEAITCGYLSLVVVIGLVAQLVFSAWWVDGVTSLGILYFLVKESREAWIGAECCRDFSLAGD